MIIFKGNAISNQSIYKVVNSRVYMTNRGKLKKIDYQIQAKEQYKNMVFKGDVSLDIKLWFGDRRVRDIDNYGKLLLDSLEGILYYNDKQIKKITWEKLYDKKNPRVEISWK